MLRYSVMGSIHEEGGGGGGGGVLIHLIYLRGCNLRNWMIVDRHRYSFSDW